MVELGFSGGYASRQYARWGLLAAGLAFLLATMTAAAGGDTMSLRLSGGTLIDEPGGARNVILALPSHAGPVTVPPAPGLREYVDMGGRFHAPVPAGWALRKQPDSSEITLLSGDTTISVAVETVPAGTSADSMLDLIGEDIRQQCPTAAFGDRQAMSVAGIPGRAFVARCAGPRKPTFGQFAAAKVDDEIVLYNVVAPTEDLPVIKAAATWVLVNFQVGSTPRQHSRTPDALRRWVTFIKEACGAGVFSDPQCASRLADALRDAETADPPDK